MSTTSGSRSRRTTSLDDEVEKRLADIKLKLLDQKLGEQKRRAGRLKYHEITGRDIYRHDDELDVQLQLARMRHEDLKRQMEKERQLSEKLAERPPQQIPVNPATAQSRKRSPRDRRTDRMTDFMEMMMIQNNQVQNMILNQTLLKQANDRPSNPPPQQYPMVIPMPMPNYTYPYQQPYGPERKPPTPKPETPKAKPPESPKKTPRKQKKNDDPFPFPGNYSQQKLRRLAYAAFFLATLNRLTNENKFRPTQDFLFDLKLKEIIESLHRIYQAPDGQMFNVTVSTVMGEDTHELTELLNVPKTLSRADEKVVSQELSYAVENTVFQITEIMPTTGILGTHRKSGVFEILRSGNRYPHGYFYDFESEMLEFTEDGHVGQVTDNDAMMLIIGIFMIRALVETLYLKTEHYGMVPETTPKAERNIKLMASILTYLHRKITAQLAARNRGTKKSKVQLPALPQVLSSSLYSDQEIRPILKLIKKSLDYSENLIMQWAEEYVRRLREAAF